MKTIITLQLDAALLREIRVLAAEEGTSISALLTARLEQIVRERKTYERARKRALLGCAMDLICVDPCPFPQRAPRKSKVAEQLTRETLALPKRLHLNHDHRDAQLPLQGVFRLSAFCHAPAHSLA
jgi:hypothetical protein